MATVSAKGEKAKRDRDRASGLNRSMVNFRLLAKQSSRYQTACHPVPVVSPLRQPGFRYFFGGRLISLLGSAMAPVALAFAVLDASHRATDLGVVLAARLVPLLGFVLVGGAIADRFPRRAVLILANLGSALTQGGVAAVLLTGHYSLVLVAALSVGNGILDAFTTPALRGLLPELVAKNQLRQANALLGTTQNATKILGPALAGVLVVSIGSGPTIAFDAATFLAAAVLLAPLRTTTPMPSRRATLLHDLRSGWSVYRRTTWLLAVTASSSMMNLVQVGTWQVLGPELTKHTSGEAAWGFVLSARGIGLLVMSALMYKLVVRHLLRLGQLMSALGCLPLLALGLQLNALWLAAAAFIAGLGFSISGISWETSLQEHVDPAMLSRLSSYDDLLSFAAIPIGLLAVGPLADRFGAPAVATAAAAIYLLVAWASLLSRDVRDLTHQTSPSAAPAPAAVPSA